MGRKTILVIEDNPYLAKVITENLGRDFDCKLAASPAEVLPMMLSGELAPAAVVTSLGTRGMSGHDFLIKLRDNTATAEVPFVILSSEKASAVRVRMINDGADDFITKPFNPQELLARLKRILHRTER